MTSRRGKNIDASDGAVRSTHTHDVSAWRHEHVFDTGNAAGEGGTLIVTGIRAAMMAVEIAAGWLFSSMAPLAEGLHMSRHAVSIGVAALMAVGWIERLIDSPPIRDEEALWIAGLGLVVSRKRRPCHDRDRALRRC